MVESAIPAPDDDWPPRAREAFLDALWSLVVAEERPPGGGPPPWLAEVWRGGSPAAGSVIGDGLPTVAPSPGDPSRSAHSADDAAETTALHRVLACGVDPDDLTDVVREMQHEVIYNLCQLLDEPGLLGFGLDGGDSRPPEFRWHLAATRATAPEAPAPCTPHWTPTTPVAVRVTPAAGPSPPTCRAIPRTCATRWRKPGRATACGRSRPGARRRAYRSGRRRRHLTRFSARRNEARRLRPSDRP